MFVILTKWGVSLANEKGVGERLSSLSSLPPRRERNKKRTPQQLLCSNMGKRKKHAGAMNLSLSLSLSLSSLSSLSLSLPLSLF
jgi:hypothetical protein